MIKEMLKLSTFITGDEYQIAKQADPISKRKITIVASLLLVPTFMWLVNGYLITKMVLDHSWTVALVVAIGCGFIIFILERAIIHVKGPWISSFRILLGLLIAVIGSIGWDEVIFEKDIDNHMIKYKAELAKERIDNKLSDHALSLQLQKEAVDKAYIDWQTSLNIALSEADGTGGSGIRGISNITNLKIEAAHQKKEIYNTLEQKYELLQTEAQKTKKLAESEFNSTFNDHSLLTRIKVLFDMVFNDWYMLIPYLLITSLLVVLEFIVIIYKLSSDKTAYECRLDAIQNVTIKRIQEMTSHLKQNFDPVRGNPKYMKAMEATQKPMINIFDN